MIGGVSRSPPPGPHRLASGRQGSSCWVWGAFSRHRHRAQPLPPFPPRPYEGSGVHFGNGCSHSPGQRRRRASASIWTAPSSSAVETKRGEAWLQPLVLLAATSCLPSSPSSACPARLVCAVATPGAPVAAAFLTEAFSTHARPLGNCAPCGPIRDFSKMPSHIPRSARHPLHRRRPLPRRSSRGGRTRHLDTHRRKLRLGAIYPPTPTGPL